MAYFHSKHITSCNIIVSKCAIIMNLDRTPCMVLYHDQFTVQFFLFSCSLPVIMALIIIACVL